MALGFVIGKIRVRSFRLGNVVGTLLAGVLIGQLDIHVAPVVKTVFFALFRFATGYKVGPQFFHGLKRNALTQVLLTVVLCLTSLVTTVTAAKRLRYDCGTAAGLMAGAFTESTVIGTAGDTIARLDLPDAERNRLLNNIPVAYAAQIPSGDKHTLFAGAKVFIHQVLGGSYTVQTDTGLFRLDGKDADAIGKDVPPAAPAEGGAAAGDLETRIWDLLKSCYDSEIPVNIVDLGLVYDMQVAPMGEGRHRVDVKMTLTAPGCGMGDVLAQDVRDKLEKMEEVGRAEVEIVFDPPWNPSMMSEAARLQLGFF